MKVILSLICLAVLVVWSLKKLRAKEQQKFLAPTAEDSVLLEKIRSGSDRLGEVEPEEDDPILLRAQAYLIKKSATSVIRNTTSKTATATELSTVGSNKPVKVKLKKIVLSERLRNLLETMEDAYGDNYRFFVHLPLENFLDGPPTQLAGRQVSLLMCDRLHFQVVAAIEFQKSEDLEKIFREVGLPLVIMPRLSHYTEDLVREKLSHLSLV